MKEEPEDVRIDAYNLRNLSSLFLEFSHSLRLLLFKTLKEKKRHTEISKILDISPQETTRHLRRLMRANLIEKDSEGFYSPTSFGLLVLRLLPLFEFVSSRKNYFLKHSLEEVPYSSLLNLHKLEKAYLGEEGIDGLFRAKEMFSDAHEYMYVMSKYGMSASIPIVLEKLREGVRFRILLEKKAFKELEYPKPTEDVKNLELRFLENLNTTILLNEREALLSFPKKSGDADYTCGFSGEAFEFLNWCKDLFHYFWEKSKPL
ncbi:MAG: hypothetical protein ACE5K0_04055 [Candidatus Methanofastidiosia archaeon]